MSATESDPEWDLKWEHLRNPNESNTKKDGTIMDKGIEDDPRCTNYRKLKISDKKNDAWTIRIKKSRVSVQILIISLSYQVCKEGHLHQAS